MKPKLRFNEFSEDWREKKLGEFCYNISSGKSSKCQQGEYNLYGSTGIIGKTNDIECEGDFILVARVGVNAGKVNIVNGIYGVSDNTLIIRNKEDLLVKFLYYQLDFYNLNKLVFGSGQPLITASDLKKLKLEFPSLYEQTKIANFLSNVDKKIQNQQDKITHLENIKKGFMQKIFSRKIRFKDENGNEFPEWEEKKLDEIAYLKKGVQLDKDEIVEGGKYYHLNGGINPSNYTNKYNVQENTISISEGGNSCGYINWNKEKFFSGGHNYTLQKVSSFIDKYYLYQYLKYNEDKIMRLRVGSGLPNIQQKDLNKFIIKVPLLTEQEKIADFLSSFDKKIDVEKDTLNHLKELKKGLLQQVLV